jgi:ribonuclease G
MHKEILINATNEEKRIAVVEEEQLVEFFVESPNRERMVGDIYKGRVRKVLPGMQAAFIDIGFSQDAFLHFSDIGNTFTAAEDDELEEENIRSAHNLRERAKNISSSLHANQDLLVQIIKEPISNKGPRVTTDISLAGRYVVLLTNQQHVGVSRKITKPGEKKRLRRIAADHLPKGFGTIIRTAAAEKEDADLVNDYEYLLKLWRKIERHAAQAPALHRVHQDMNMVDAVIRDHFNADVDRVLIDSRKEYREIKSYLRDFAPPLLDKLEYHKSRQPLFDNYQIEDDLQRSLEKKVWMKNGGYLFIEHTEALTSVDVNSGRFIGRKDHESNAMKTNLEAVREIARQLRLRDIGGIIIIDFIDVGAAGNKFRIYKDLLRELRRDRAITKVGEISRFGLIEMTRQRIRPSLIYNIYEICKCCNGHGQVPTMGHIVSKIERWIKRYRSQWGDRRLILQAHPEVVAYLDDGFYSRRYELMFKNFISLTLESDADMKKHEFRFLLKRNRKEMTAKIKS